MAQPHTPRRNLHLDASLPQLRQRPRRMLLPTRGQHNLPLVQILTQNLLARSPRLTRHHHPLRG
jgi:hypothetical protein